MDAKTLLERLFPGGCDVAFDGIYFSGTGHCAGTDVAVIDTVDNTGSPLCGRRRCRSVWCRRYGRSRFR